MNREEEIQKEIEEIKRDYPNHTEIYYEERIPYYSELKAELEGIQETEARILGIIEKVFKISDIKGIKKKADEIVEVKLKEQKEKLEKEFGDLSDIKDLLEFQEIMVKEFSNKFPILLMTAFKKLEKELTQKIKDKKE